jgi:type IV pilus assembly protein PilB
MATHAATTRNLSGLARALAQHGLMTEYEAESLQAQAQAAGVTFVDHVLSGKRLTSNQLAVFASRAFGIPLLDLASFDTDQFQKDLIDIKIAQTRHVLPLLKRGNRLYVATSDPANLQGLEEIRFKTNLVVEPVVVESDKLAAVIHKLVEASGATLKDVGSMEDLEVDLQESDVGGGSSDEERAEGEDAPGVR